MLVPAAVKKLDEAHAALGEAPRQQTIGGECAGLASVRTIELESALRFLREIGELGHGTLHPVRHLVLGDASGDFRIAEFVERETVQLTKIIDKAPPVVAGKARRIGQI